MMRRGYDAHSEITPEINRVKNWLTSLNFLKSKVYANAAQNLLTSLRPSMVNPSLLAYGLFGINDWLSEIPITK